MDGRVRFVRLPDINWPLRAQRIRPTITQCRLHVPPNTRDRECVRARLAFAPSCITKKAILCARRKSYTYTIVLKAATFIWWVGEIQWWCFRAYTIQPYHRLCRWSECTKQLIFYDLIIGQCHTQYINTYTQAEEEYVLAHHVSKNVRSHALVIKYFRAHFFTHANWMQGYLLKTPC